MKRRYFLFQLKAFLINPKNIGLYIVTIVLSLYFGLASVPNHQVIERVDPQSIKKEYVDDTIFLKAARMEIAYSKKPGYNYMPSRGATDAAETYPTLLKYDKKLLEAMEKKDWPTYTAYASARYKYIDDLIFIAGNQNFMYPAAYNHDDNYHQDGHQGYQRTYHLYNALLESHKRKNTPLNKAILEETTALQRIQNSLGGWAALILVIIVCLFAADIVTNDKKYYTVLNDIPLSKRTILWLKTGVVEAGVLTDFVIATVIVLICIVPRYGFGSFNLNTVVFLGRVHFKQTFVTESLGIFYLQFSALAVVLTFIFIRLTMLLSLIFRNEYLAGMLSSLFAISGKIVYFSMGMGYVHPFLEKLPMSYFTFGDVLTGSLAYLMDSPGWGIKSAIGPLALTILVIEVFLLLITQGNRIPLVNEVN